MHQKLSMFIFTVASMLALVCMPAKAQAAECSLYEQSHPSFLLDGAHLSTGNCSVCSSCHRAGVFVGTPKSCVTCHNGSPDRVTVGRSIAHIPTGVVECNQCHSTTAFSPTATMNHISVQNQTCVSCHGGGFTVYGAQQQGPNHPSTSADCANCHTTTNWNINHGAIHANVTTNCISCHNNNITSGKKPNHPSTSDACELCHSINANFKCATVILGKRVNYVLLSIVPKNHS